MKYNLKIGKDLVVYAPEMKDEYPEMFDIDSEGNKLEKVSKQKGITAFKDIQGKEVQKASGKGIEVQGKVIPLTKVESGIADDIKEVPYSTIFNYAVLGEHQVLDSTLKLKEGMAIEFLFATGSGYLNTIRGFIYQDKEGNQWIIKTTIKTKNELRYIETPKATKTKTATKTSALSQLQKLGMI